MGRPRKYRKDLPECVYFKNGGYYFVSNNKWTSLGKDYASAMAAWSKLIVPTVRPEIYTINDLLDRYSREVLPGKAERTQKDNLQEMRFLRAFFGEIAIVHVTSAMVAEYVETREAKTRANREIALLSHAFNKAILWGCTTHNPCSIPGLRNTETPRDRYVTDEEVEAFKEHCPAWLKTYIDLKLLLGLRQQNMLALRHEDLQSDAIRVEIMKRKKTEKVTRLKILRSPEVDAVLASLKTKSGHCFQTTSGNPYSSSGFNSIWKRAMVKFVSTGGERFHEHDLRGKVATDMGDARAAQQLLGHKTLAQTEEYIKSRDTDVVQPNRRRKTQ